jgi:hypothetical protein
VKFVQTALILCLITAAWARDGNKPVEPPVPSVLYYLDSSGQLVPLEHRIVRVKHKIHTKGFAGFTSIYQVEGEKSPLRLSAGGIPEFVVRLASRVDPLESVQFYRFDGVNGSRILPVENTDALGIVIRILPNPATIDFNAVQYGSFSFKLIPIHPLEPGEYCFVVALVNKPARQSSGSCLGIDTGSK